MWDELSALQLEASDASGRKEDHHKAGGGQLHGVAGGKSGGANLQGENNRRRLPDQQLEKGESGQNWPLIILATILGLLATAIVAAGVAAFMLRKTIITGLLAATLGPRATEITAGMQATTDDSGGRVKNWENLLTETSCGKPEVKKEKATGASQKGQRSRTKPKKEEESSFDLEKLTKFMISPQHSMGDGYARRKCNNCWDGKSTRDADKGVFATLHGT
jgi:hypothetical protein